MLAGVSRAKLPQPEFMMPTYVFTPATVPTPDRADPFLLFIQQAQLAIYYREDRRSPLSRAAQRGDSRITTSTSGQMRPRLTS